MNTQQSRVVTSSAPIQVRAAERVPAYVIAALVRRQGQYTDMKTVFHCIQISECHWVGVAGDGDNGIYEHFSMRSDRFECSDVGYGDTVVALRDILVKEVS